MELTFYFGNCAGEEYIGADPGAERAGKLAAIRAYLRPLDARRRLELFHVAVGTEFRGTLHKLRPDGESGACAFEIEVAIVVETDPYHAEQLCSETGEPPVA